ncbi:hypothetical protein RIVM261_070560 [Rivularia sp. IAM M-261]|nr:hypothetical protein RIVM261_070560 [Rivularia sp. IAM M-261]
MSYLIRNAILDDASRLGELLDAFIQETFQKQWGGNIQQLQQDGFGREFEIIVAESSQEIIAFLAWTSSYDLHHCIKGGEFWAGLFYQAAPPRVTASEPRRIKFFDLMACASIMITIILK